MLRMIRLVFFLLCMAIWSQLNSQIWTEGEVIQKTLTNYPSIQIANAEVQRWKAFEKTAFNPEQPKFTIETPTDVGLGYEVEQEFDFPTVYGKRKEWLKSQTGLATEIASITQRELIREVRIAFLNAQMAQAQFEYYTTQDSLWREIANKSQRLFDAGEINRADLIFAEKQSGLIRLSLFNANTEKVNALAILHSYTNEPVNQIAEIAALPIDTVDLSETFYFDNYFRQSVQVAQNEIELAQAHRWPGLIIGYLKAPEPDTEFRYRFKAGITVPIWQGQYTGEVEAAKANIEKANWEAELKQREARINSLNWINSVRQGKRNLEYFETSTLPQMKQLVEIYLRLYEAGEVDYALTLRNITDAFDVNKQYLETLKQYNQSIIEFDYLKGKN